MTDMDNNNKSVKRFHSVHEPASEPAAAEAKSIENAFALQVG